MTRTERVAEWVDDRVNPVLLKELRQAVRGRFVVSALILSLLAEVVTVATMYAVDQLSQFRFDSSPVGEQTFGVLFTVTFVACLLFVPLYSGLRMSAERGDANTDLMYITTIAPRSIVIGKLLAVMAFVGLLFGAALPFLAFAYVLRGLDLLPCIIALAFALLVIVAEAALALFIGALPVTRPFKVMLGLSMVTFSLLLPMAGLELMTLMRTSAIVRTSGANSLVMLVATFLTISFLSFIVIVLTTGLLTPPTANRALPIRIMLSVVWVITLGLTVRGVFFSKSFELMQIWGWTEIGLIAAVLLSAIGEREVWGPRVARTIPRRGFGRLIAFLFYSGAAGGVLWSVMMFLLTIGAMVIGASNFVSSDRDADLLMAFDMAGAVAAILAYALTAVRVHRRFLARRIPQKNTWAVAVLLLIVFSVILPVLATVRFVETQHFNRAFELATAMNPFSHLDSPVAALARLCALLMWLVVVTALNRRWIGEQWTRFRRPEPPPVVPVGARAVETSAPLQELVSE